MKTIRFKTNIRAFFYKNWFNLGLGCFIAFMLIEKDFSINFRLTDPTPDPGSIKVVPDEQVTKQPKTKKFSLKGFKRVESQKGSLLDQIPSYSNPKPSSVQEAVDPLLALRQMEETQIRSFLQRFGNVAGNEMKKFGIPASIILGQAMLGSVAGTNQLASDLNNYFGRKCTQNWNGPSSEFNGTCYSKFETAWNAFREQSLFLSDGPYSHLTNLDSKDYTRWAKGLEMSGYDPKAGYGQQLIEVIEEYQLHRFDQ